MAASMREHLRIVPDPRIDRTKLHKLEDIMMLAICAVICGAETWVDIVEFGRAKKDFFRTFLELPNGIPSHDTFGRVFAAMDADAFEKALGAWVKGFAGTSEGKLVAIDGKTIRRSLDHASDRAGIHMVSAWVHENHAVFGQLRVEDKSNEIKAIPKLLEILELKGSTVTIDAIGCQREIAGKILEKGGQYVLAVKGNQGALYEDIRLFLDDCVERGFRGVEYDSYEQLEKGHGRIETRRTWTTSQVKWLQDRHGWPGLKSIAVMDCQREIGIERSIERRYFISSLPHRAAQRIASVVRKHWRVENELHWCLDVCFGEDDSRARIGNAAENLSRVRRIALMMLKQDTSAKIGVKARRHKAGWDQQYLLKILNL